MAGTEGKTSLGSIYAASGTPIDSIGVPSTSIGTDATVTFASKAFTTVTNSAVSFVSSGNSYITTTIPVASVVTDPAVFASLQASDSSASLAAESRKTSTTHVASSTPTAAANNKSKSNLSTIIPAVVIPVAVVLVATFALFWFFMRRRHRRDLQNQPAFVMAAKTEKLASTSNSLASSRDGHGLAKETAYTMESPRKSSEKPLRFGRRRSISSGTPGASFSLPPSYPAEEIGLARPLTAEDDQRGDNLLPPLRTTDAPFSQNRHVANFNKKTSPTSGNQKERSPYSSRNPRAPQNSVVPDGARQLSRNTSGRGPHRGNDLSPVASSRHRSQSLSNTATREKSSNTNLNNSYFDNYPTIEQRPPTAPSSTSRALLDPRKLSPTDPLYFTGQRNFSPVGGHRAPPPPPINPSAPLGAFNGGSAISQYSPIIKNHPRSKRPSVIVPQLARIPPQQQLRSPFADHPTSPLLPSPNSDSLNSHNLTAENLRIARLANTSRLGFMSTPEPSSAARQHPGNISDISDAHEPYAKSDVSSLNELERFDFERDVRESQSLHEVTGGRASMANDSYWDGEEDYSPVVANDSGRTSYERSWMR